MKIDCNQEKQRITLENIDSDDLFFSLMDEIRNCYQLWRNLR